MSKKNLAAVGNSDLRLEKRDENMGFHYPITFEIRCISKNARGWGPYALETVNYHHRGACFRIPHHLKDKCDFENYQELEWSVDLFCGTKKINEMIPIEICWERIKQDGMFGVKFISPESKYQIRAPRFKVNQNYPATLTGDDPLDPNREIYFKIINVSKTGLLLSTSMSNRHLMPGMIVKNNTLSMPGKTIKSCINFKIANSRASAEEQTILLGAEIIDQSPEYAESMSSYLSLFSVMEEGKDRAELLRSHQFFSKKIKQGLTYRIIGNEKEYQEVLDLRYLGYRLAKKTLKDSTPQSQGEGLANEGTIFGAYLGSQLIASMECRFFGGDKILRATKHFNLEKFIADHPDKRFVEFSKLVIHPNAQGTDVMVGIIQKIHALLVARGGYDQIVMATDSLLSLYKKAGFKETGMRTIHPVNPELNLHLLFLDREVFMSAGGVNPFAWAMICEVTQKYMEDIGLAKPIKFKARQKFSKWATGLAFHTAEHFKKRKKTSTVRKELKKVKKNEAKANQNFLNINPQWTEQHYIVSVLLPYILEAERLIGPLIVNEILATLKMPRTYFFEPGNWVSVKFLDAFLDEYSRFGSIAELSHAAGLRGTHPDVFGMKYYFVKHVATPKTFFKLFESNFPEINRTRTYTMIEEGQGRVQLKIGTITPDLLPKHRESCQNWQSNLFALLHLITGKGSTVLKTSCCYDGDSHCTYELKWNTKRKYFSASFRVAFQAIASIALYFSGQLFFQQNLIPAIMIFNLAFLYFEKLYEFKKLHSKFKQFENSSNDRYEHLQQAKNQLLQRVDELLLIEQTSHAVQKNHDLHGIFTATLDAICKQFHFSRAFIMLIDESKDKLQVAAMNGKSDHAEKLWKFEVNVREKRDAPLVLSSVYHTGKSVLINDVEKHKAKLNAASQHMLEALNVTGFTIVAIPSGNGCWGVIVADKSTFKTGISESDVRLLERIGGQLGLALDKQQVLQNEKTKTALFQKFVPAFAKADMLKDVDANIGWQMRDTVAMFVDIRNYTSATASLPPNAIAEMVNAFYGHVQKVAEKHGGYVDKFIGDAALITWGYLSTIGEDSNAALQCALELLNGLSAINATLEKDCIPGISLSIGIDRGATVCGLFGCDQRMEFTGIGTPLNRASRLQALCKELETDLVFSEKVYLSVQQLESEKHHFKEESISIRGFSGLSKVYKRKSA